MRAYQLSVLSHRIIEMPTLSLLSPDLQLASSLEDSHVGYWLRTDLN